MKDAFLRFFRTSTTKLKTLRRGVHWNSRRALAYARTRIIYKLLIRCQQFPGGQCSWGRSSPHFWNFITWYESIFQQQNNTTTTNNLWSFWRNKESSKSLVQRQRVCRNPLLKKASSENSCPAANAVVASPGWLPVQTFPHCCDVEEVSWSLTEKQALGMRPWIEFCFWGVQKTKV